MGKNKDFAPPSGWTTGKLVSTKEWIDYFYDDDMCKFLDSEVTPGQIRSSIFNEANTDRGWEHGKLIVWDKFQKKAVAYKMEKKNK